MIKFFSKIRYDLMGKNKIGKYLKYAIGEIILVVIGILFALSINNWNENRKSEITKNKILEELKHEFQGNLILIEEHENNIIDSNNCLIKVLNYSAGKEKGLTIDSIRSYSSKMLYIHNLAITKSSLDAIIASGKISLLDSELTSSLTGFETDFNTFNDVSLIAGQRYNSKSANSLMLNLAFYQKFHNYLYPDKPLKIHPKFKKNDDDFENYIKDPDTYAIINQLYVGEIFNRAWVSHLKENVKNILAIIETSQSMK